MKIRLKFVFRLSGQPARIRNARKVSYFLLSRLSRDVSRVLGFFGRDSMCWRISLRHLYFVMNGTRHGDYFMSTIRA